MKEKVERNYFKKGKIADCPSFNRTILGSFADLFVCWSIITSKFAICKGNDMKKFLVILLSALCVLSLTACGDSKKNSEAETTDKKSDNQQTSDKDESGSQSTIKSPLDLLNTVWNTYKDDEKFSAAGGEMTEDKAVMDAPGEHGVTDSAVLDSSLGFPPAAADKIDAAASLVHMMNANTFTCGAFHVKNKDDISEITGLLKDNILQRQWICGFPDKLVVVTVDDYIVSFFGENEIVETFKTKLTAACSSAKVVIEEPIQ